MIPILLGVLIIGSSVVGMVYHKPGTFEITQMQLAILEAKLGVIQPDGSILTMDKFGGQIKTLTRDFPVYMITKDNGFSDKVLFYMDCKEALYEYSILPSDPSNIRTNWRLAHPEGEAKLLIWGMFDESVFTIDSPEWKEVSKLLSIWATRYRISARMLPKWAHW